ncbi:hypothetical protein [Nostoc sp.]
MNSSVQSVFLLSCRQTTLNCKSELPRTLDAIAFTPFEQCQLFQFLGKVQIIMRSPYVPDEVTNGVAEITNA